MKIVVMQCAKQLILCLIAGVIEINGQIGCRQTFLAL
ncbi:hypothetical protein FBZ98_101796 [Rhizobium sp. ERR 922]|nr:hypothetical protein FBZ98_101796 [Rhizobium sp. ERR 922]TWC04381.1 hypothetical protein FBZ97_101796 [Rhizobium sp. ERR 942]